MAFKCQSKAQRLEEMVNDKVDEIVKVALDALNGDRGIQRLTNKAYADKGIIKSEKTLADWDKSKLKGVDFREVFKALTRAGYKIEIVLSKESVTFGNVQNSPCKG